MLKNFRALYQVLHDIKLSESKKESLISKRLKSVLIASYEYIPYYRKIMQGIGYNPLKDYSDPKDLTRLPIITKKDLKTHNESLFLKKNVDTSKLYTEVPEYFCLKTRF